MVSVLELYFPRVRFQKIQQFLGRDCLFLHSFHSLTEVRIFVYNLNGITDQTKCPCTEIVTTCHVHGVKILSFHPFILLQPQVSCLVIDRPIYF